jgi:hypothetical protein
MDKNKALLETIKAKLSEIESLSEKKVKLELGGDYDEETEVDSQDSQEDDVKVFSDSDVDFSDFLSNDDSEDSDDEDSDEDSDEVPEDSTEDKDNKETDDSEDADDSEEEDDEFENADSEDEDEDSDEDSDKPRKTKQESTTMANELNSLSEEQKTAIRAEFNKQVNKKVKGLVEKKTAQLALKESALKKQAGKLLEESKKIDAYAKYLKEHRTKTSVVKGQTKRSQLSEATKQRLEKRREERKIEQIRESIRRRVNSSTRKHLVESRVNKERKADKNRELVLESIRAKIREKASKKRKEQIIMDEQSRAELAAKIAERRTKYLNEQALDNCRNAVIISEAEAAFVSSEKIDEQHIEKSLESSLSFLDRLS